MTAKEFYLDTPLYTKVKTESMHHLATIVGTYSTDDFDGYNPIAKIDTTFTLSNGVSDVEKILITGPNHAHIRCLRTKMYFYFYFIYNPKDGTLEKIGQYPSIADFHISKVKQYDKIFNKSYLKEFTKAIGLAAHGVGIGSFVYLRRIFETLIFEAADEMEKKGNFDHDHFKPLRMSDKIAYLHDYLPVFLVDHKDLYGILSAGIHELDEDICLEHFEVVKVGIEFILDEKLERWQKQKKIDEASARIKQTSTIFNNAQKKLPPTAESS